MWSWGRDSKGKHGYCDCCSERDVPSQQGPRQSVGTEARGKGALFPSSPDGFLALPLPFAHRSGLSNEQSSVLMPGARIT